MIIANRPLRDCNNVPTIGGIQKVWYRQRKDQPRRWALQQTNVHQLGVITGGFDNVNIVTSPVPFYPLPARPSDATLVVERDNGQANSYNITLSLVFNKMDFSLRDDLERLIMSTNSVFIVKDYNGSYWMIGESYGCKTQIAGQTDTAKGNNTFTITATCRERWMPRELSCGFINTYVEIPTTPISTLTFAQLAALTNTELRGLFLT